MTEYIPALLVVGIAFAIALGSYLHHKYFSPRRPRIEDTPGWETNTWIIRKDRLLRGYNIPELRQ